jgi:hypothetical protein
MPGVRSPRSARLAACGAGAVAKPPLVCDDPDRIENVYRTIRFHRVRRAALGSRCRSRGRQKAGFSVGEWIAAPKQADATPHHARRARFFLPLERSATRLSATSPQNCEERGDATHVCSSGSHSPVLRPLSPAPSERARHRVELKCGSGRFFSPRSLAPAEADKSLQALPAHCAHGSSLSVDLHLPRGKADENTWTD